MYKITQKHRSPFQHRYLYFIIPLFLIVAVIAALELTNTTHLFHTHHAAVVATTAGQATKGEPASGSTSPTPAKTDPSASSSTTEPGDTKGTPAESTNLLEPSGNFVSAHHNVPLTAAMSSVCNSTSGASCSIVFTMDGVTESLPAHVTDRGGAAYWNSWTPQSVGLTSGTWKVSAVATLNGQTKTTDDATDLEIQ